MAETDESLIYGKLRIHLVSRTVYVNEQEIVLTKMELNKIAARWPAKVMMQRFLF